MMRIKRKQKRAVAIFLTTVTLLAFRMPASALAGAEKEVRVLPGGMAFGVQFVCEGLVVVGFTDVVSDQGVSSPAYDAGLRVNDRISSVNGIPVKQTEDLIAQVEHSSTPVEISYQRNGEKYTVRFQPAYSKEEGKYKTGMWVRDTTAGIGTVTFIVPETGAFAGLGHGICDQNTGELLPMERGKVLDVEISGITKGASGRPGELRGHFVSQEDKGQSGVLLGNTQAGVYGMLESIPYEKIPEEAMPLGTHMHTGEAYIWCTLSDNEVGKYSIEITDTDERHNFGITVTDVSLIEKTGGIVQGMSGSPIIQDGCLVGAVTHVLIGDPTRGYGIPIGEMFREMPALLI